MTNVRAGLAMALAFAGMAGAGAVLTAAPANAASAPVAPVTVAGNFDQQGRGFHGVMGTVTAKAADSITLQTRNNQTQTITVNASTTYAVAGKASATLADRSEEHTSELQSH